MFRDHISSNKRRTVFLFVIYLFIYAGVGAATAYYFDYNVLFGAIGLTIFGFVYSAITVSASKRLVMRMNGAKQITDKNMYPTLYNVVEELSIITHIKMPDIYIIDTPALNAFATGMSPDNAAVAATRGLLETLNREELEAVMAHEFAHIKNYDMRLQTAAVALSSIISWIGGNMFWFGRGSSDDDDNPVVALLSVLAIMLAPVFMSLMQLAISRNREYLADSTAIEFTRNPKGLISALRKLSQGPKYKEADRTSHAMYIINPLLTKGDSWMSTHPSIENRIQRLEAM